MEIGGVLKSLELMGESGRVSFGIKSREDKIFVKNIKGSTLGKTLKAHADKPESACEMKCAGFAIMHTKKKIIKMLIAAFRKGCPIFFAL